MHFATLCNARQKIGGMLVVCSYTKTAFYVSRMRFYGDSDRIQTCNLLIRSQMLYSVELRSRYFQIANLVVLNCSNLLLLNTSLLT